MCITMAHRPEAVHRTTAPGLVSLWTEVAFDLFGGVVIGLLPLPNPDCVLRRLREHRTAALDLHGLDVSAGLNQHFQSDGTAEFHGAGDCRIGRRHPDDDSTHVGALLVLRESGFRLDVYQQCDEQQGDEWGGFHNTHKLSRDGTTGKSTEAR